MFCGSFKRSGGLVSRYSDALRPLNCTQKRDGFFPSKDERRKNRKEIFSEISKGYFGDLHEFRKNKGKRFSASERLLSKKEAVLFPRMDCRSLLGSDITIPNAFRGQVTLVTLSMRDIGIKICDEYRVPFIKAFPSEVAVYEVAVIEQMVYKLLRSVLIANLKQTIESNRHERFLSYSGKFIDAKKHLLIHNSIIGYVFLLDENGYIRWTSHGYPKPLEIDLLIRCTNDLLKI
jgi:hypothetical protein